MARISLGRCNDPKVLEMVKLVKERAIQAGDSVIASNGKRYNACSDVVYSCAHNEVGEVHKMYRLHNNGEWHLKRRSVKNERGSYSRNTDSVMGKPEDSVSLGGQQSFEKQNDGTYIQRAYAHYPARQVTSKEIEAAIDYVKGNGAAENYTRLLRDYNK